MWVFPMNCWKAFEMQILKVVAEKAVWLYDENPEISASAGSSNGFVSLQATLYPGSSPWEQKAKLHVNTRKSPGHVLPPCSGCVLRAGQQSQSPALFFRHELREWGTWQVCVLKTGKGARIGHLTSLTPFGSRERFQTRPFSSPFQNHISACICLLCTQPRDLQHPPLTVKVHTNQSFPPPPCAHKTNH